MSHTKHYPLSLKGLKVLEHLIEINAPVSARKLYQLMSIPKPTMYRILAALEEENYIRKYENSKYQVIDQSCFDLSANTLSHWQIQRNRSIILGALSEKIKETCNLSILVDHEVVYIDRVEADSPVKVQLAIGSRLPMHCTAAGKLFLAYMRPSKRKTFIDDFNLTKTSINTLIDTHQLFEHCKEIRKKGYSIADEELSIGSMAIAVPVFSSNKKLKENMSMAVSIQAPRFRTPLHKLHEFLPDLQQCAHKIQKLYNDSFIRPTI